MTKPTIIQLCHDTKGPFIDICALYAEAFSTAGYAVHTVFLKGEPTVRCRVVLSSSTLHFLELPPATLKGLKLRAIYQVYSLCRQLSVDIIFAHRYKTIYLAALISRPLNCRVFGIAHTLNVFARRGRRLFIEYLCPRAQLIGVSETVAKNLRSHCPRLAKAQRIAALPNAIDIKNHDFFSKQESRSRLQLPADAQIFGCIGRLVAYKSHDSLIQAFAQSAPPNSLLVLIGDGECKASLTGLAESLRISDRVHFMGHVPEAKKFLTAFDAFVFPSNDEEAFGVVLLEAMLARVPILCSDAAGPQEVVGPFRLSFKQRDPASLAAAITAFHQLSPTQKLDMATQAYQRCLKTYSLKPFQQKLLALL